MLILPWGLGCLKAKSSNAAVDLPHPSQTEAIMNLDITHVYLKTVWKLIYFMGTFCRKEKLVESDWVCDYTHSLNLLSHNSSTTPETDPGWNQTQRHCPIFVWGTAMIRAPSWVPLQLCFHGHWMHLPSTMESLQFCQCAVIRNNDSCSSTQNSWDSCKMCLELHICTHTELFYMHLLLFSFLISQNLSNSRILHNIIEVSGYNCEVLQH